LRLFALIRVFAHTSRVGTGAHTALPLDNESE